VQTWEPLGPEPGQEFRSIEAIRSLYDGTAIYHTTLLGAALAWLASLLWLQHVWPSSVFSCQIRLTKNSSDLFYTFNWSWLLNLFVSRGTYCRRPMITIRYQNTTWFFLVISAGSHDIF
jgi:hypothetical protein